ncbi:GFA family protein [Janthinobacterium sp. 78]|jgi:hypothetical protein|uniref:GFA family protein n=1 Tax=Janthinobacterium sp. 78 TaxID=2135631 RepID=UPI000D5DB87F|nr:GFA family protein [Janthinobacterium sp. 78]PVX35326.1 hypothetical protein C8C92_1912 [Janthinobacterium sp. 78]
MIKGSCCCGSVKFELASPPSMMGMCHCSRCRKAGASALAFVDKNSFTLLEGREFIQRYEPEPPFKYARTFCKNCGTSLGEIGSESDSFPISVNCLDDDPEVRIQFHVYVGSKPAWYEICDNAKQFQESPT